MGGDEEHGGPREGAQAVQAPPPHPPVLKEARRRLQHGLPPLSTCSGTDTDEPRVDLAGLTPNPLQTRACRLTPTTDPVRWTETQLSTQPCSPGLPMGWPGPQTLKGLDAGQGVQTFIWGQWGDPGDPVTWRPGVGGWLFCKRHKGSPSSHWGHPSVLLSRGQDIWST